MSLSEAQSKAAKESGARFYREHEETPWLLVALLMGVSYSVGIFIGWIIWAVL